MPSSLLLWGCFAATGGVVATVQLLLVRWERIDEGDGCLWFGGLISLWSALVLGSVWAVGGSFGEAVQSTFWLLPFGVVENWVFLRFYARAL